jgi:dephospho-CoA kinase
MPIAKKVELADELIDNRGSPEETRRQFDAVYARLLARARAQD